MANDTEIMIGDTGLGGSWSDLLPGICSSSSLASLSRPQWLPEEQWPFPTLQTSQEGQTIAVTDVGKGQYCFSSIQGYGRSSGATSFSVYAVTFGASPLMRRVRAKANAFSQNLLPLTDPPAQLPQLSTGLRCTMLHS